MIRPSSSRHLRPFNDPRLARGRCGQSRARSSRSRIRAGRSRRRSTSTSIRTSTSSPRATFRRRAPERCQGPEAFRLPRPLLATEPAARRHRRRFHSSCALSHDALAVHSWATDLLRRLSRSGNTSSSRYEGHGFASSLGDSTSCATALDSTLGKEPAKCARTNSSERPSQRWLSGFWVLPPGAALLSTTTSIAKDARPNPDKAW